MDWKREGIGVAVSFDTYLVRPLLPGGAGQIQTAIRVSGDTLERVVVKIGLAAAAGWEDATMQTVEIPLGDTPGDGEICYAAFLKAPASEGVVASWFAKLTSGGWIAGPVVTEIDLTSRYAAAFPWMKDTIIDLLKQAAADAPPSLQDGRTLAIRTAFPRDSHAMPCLSVQMTAVPTGFTMIGDSSESGTLTGTAARKVRAYNVNVDIISWTDTPEEREIIAPWLGNACMAAVDTLPFFGAHEPTFSVNESEDFETLQLPAFLVTGSINFTALSNLTFPVPTCFGHLQIVQEAPNE